MSEQFFNRFQEAISPSKIKFTPEQKEAFIREWGRVSREKITPFNDPEFKMFEDSGESTTKGNRVFHPGFGE